VGIFGSSNSREFLNGNSRWPWCQSKGSHFRLSMVLFTVRTHGQWGRLYAIRRARAHCTQNGGYSPCALD